MLKRLGRFLRQWFRPQGTQVVHSLPDAADQERRDEARRVGRRRFSTTMSEVQQHWDAKR